MFARRNSIKLMNAFGIRIGVDVSWFVILFLLILVLSGQFRSTLHSSDAVAYLTTVISALLLYASLVVHELGHALTARRHGIEVRQIDLFLFGGLTRMSRDTDTAGEEFRIAVAGPLATLGVVALCLGVDLAVVGPHRLLHAVELQSDIQITPVLLTLSWLFFMNLLLLVFNLLPAFPLDGGRIARSAVWRLTGDRARGTLISARLGQGFALLLAALGVLDLISGDSLGLWLLAIAYLIGQAARGAVVQSAFSERIDGVTVSDIMDAEPVTLPGSTPVDRALEEFYLRYRWSWFPVVDDTGRFLGVAQQEQVQEAADGGEGAVEMRLLADRSEASERQVPADRPLSEMLASEPLRRFGALMAVDSDGVLRGVITMDQVRRALTSAFG